MICSLVKVDVLFIFYTLRLFQLKTIIITVLNRLLNWRHLAGLQMSYAVLALSGFLVYGIYCILPALSPLSALYPFLKYSG